MIFPFSLNALAIYFIAITNKSGVRDLSVLHSLSDSMVKFLVIASERSLIRNGDYSPPSITISKTFLNFFH